MPFDSSSPLNNDDWSRHEMDVILRVQADESQRRRESLIVGAEVTGLAALAGGFLWLHRRKIAVATADASLNAAAALVRARRKIAAEIERRVDNA
ncbi:MAG: hypothetical protein GC182_14870 [Rhodopseudomonas sp.]|nr:hypothetical protein [Rhodopseudomonas sp.]